MSTNNITRPDAAGRSRQLTARHGWNALAGSALVAATPVVTWFAVGDQSSPGFAPEDLDYAARAPDVSAGLQAAVGIGTVVVTLAAAIVLGLALRRAAPHRRRRWLRLLGAFVAAGMYVGFAARALTAGVIGANIGAGLMIISAPFVAAPLLVVVLQAAWALWRDKPPRPGQSRWDNRW